MSRQGVSSGGYLLKDIKTRVADIIGIDTAGLGDRAAYIEIHPGRIGRQVKEPVIGIIVGDGRKNPP